MRQALYQPKFIRVDHVLLKLRFYPNPHTPHPTQIACTVPPESSIPCQSHRAASSKSNKKNRKKAAPSHAQAAAAAARNPTYPVAEALDLVKGGAKAKFDETVEVKLLHVPGKE